MALTLTTENTVLGTLAARSGAMRTAMQLGTIVLGTLVLWAAAKISVPVWPVPVTLQSLAVAAIAATFGWRIGVATILLYLAEGLSGLPVFATGGGLDYVLRPSFGFILGWVPMAFIIGYVADRGLSKKPVALFGAMVAGNAVSFAFGFAWMIVVANLTLSAGGTLPAWIDATNLVGTAWSKAIEPFVIWDILKMAFAALTVAGLWRAVRRPS
jgi:biotin transport system substrate-specific component